MSKPKIAAPDSSASGSAHSDGALSSDRAMSRLRPPYASVLDLIGQTPVVELTKFDIGKCRLFIKLESQNPGGSIKDRIALSMIAA
ncbi:MAG: pyridoxal-phosphate dependent enzyme, partial [Mesorhizobium sp.]